MEDGMALGYALGQDSNNGNNGAGMWGGDGSWIFAFLIIALIFGGNGGWGFGGGNGAGVQGALTRADLCQDMNFNNLDSAVRGVQQGLCDGFYAMNTSLLNGFNGVDNAVCTLGYQTQQGFNQTNVALLQGFNGVTAGQNAIANQLQSCCCDIRQQIGDVRYTMATDTCAIQNAIQNATRDIIDSQNAGTRSILDFMVQDKMCTLQNENQSLKLEKSQAAQNQYLINELRPTAQPAYITCNPYTGVYGGYAYNQGGCGNGYGNGCNSGCGGCCA